MTTHHIPTTIDPRETEKFISLIDGYFRGKRYRNEFGDIAPAVISNALGLVINVLNEDPEGSISKISLTPWNTDERRTSP